MEHNQDKQTATPAAPRAAKTGQPAVKNRLDGKNKSGKTASNISGETGGPSGLEPTRYGDWEKNGRCSDF